MNAPIQNTSGLTPAKRLYETPEFSLLLFREANDGFVVVNPTNKNVVEVNPAVQRLTGISRKSLLQMHLHDLIVASPKASATMKLDQMIDSTGFFHSREGYSLKQSAGNTIPINVTVSRIHIQSEPLALVVVRDITERLNYEQQERMLNKKIQKKQKLESLGVLAGGIAHDFNNLLTVILGNIDLVIASLDSESESARMLDDACKAGRRAGDLCRQMLDFVGRGRRVKSTFNLSTTIRDTLTLVDASLRERADVTVCLDDQQARVHADETQIQQIILNLLTNAFQSMHDGRGQITIRTGNMHASQEQLSGTLHHETLPTGNYVFFEVEDNGCGMDNSTQNKMFDPFFSTKEIGRGLGLASTLGIVHAHRGAIQVDTDMDNGTKIRILLPPAEDDATLNVVADKSNGLWQGSGTILVVDDDSSVLNSVQLLVNSCGFSTINCNNGRQAVEVAEQHHAEIDAVLLDLTMPDVNGISAWQELQKFIPANKIILMSGYSDNRVNSPPDSNDVVHFIQKPLDLMIISEALRAATER